MSQLSAAQAAIRFGLEVAAVTGWGMAGWRFAGSMSVTGGGPGG
jgi:hypothetical protein